MKKNASDKTAPSWQECSSKIGHMRQHTWLARVFQQDWSNRWTAHLAGKCSSKTVKQIRQHTWLARVFQQDCQTDKTAHLTDKSVLARLCYTNETLAGKKTAG